MLSVGHNYLSQEFLRMDLKTWVEPKIQVGSIVMAAVQIVAFIVIIANDHTAIGQIKADVTDIKQQQENVKLALPMAAREIEIQKDRTAVLELEEKALLTRVETLEQFEMVTRDNIAELKDDFAYIRNSGNRFPAPHR